MNSKIAPVDLTTLQERVYRELREALYQGRLTAGGSITIRGLSSALGTSEMPVREALKRLLAERVLVQASNRTFQIMPMTPSRLHELIQIRITVEGMAARLAAAAGSPELVAELTAVNDTMLTALEQGNSASILKANQEFHFAVYRAAHSPQLLELIELLWMRAGPYLAAAFATACSPGDLFSSGYRIHARLIRAIGRRDAEAAARALAVDLTTAARWYLNNGVVAEADAHPAPAHTRQSRAAPAARSTGRPLALRRIGS